MAATNNALTIGRPIGNLLDSLPVVINCGLHIRAHSRYEQRDGIYRVHIICRNLCSPVSLAHFITH